MYLHFTVTCITVYTPTNLYIHAHAQISLRQYVVKVSSKLVLFLRDEDWLGQ